MAGLTPLSALVGRDRELACLDGLLATARSGAAGVAIEGEAGIGKTAIWQAGLRRAEQAGWRVLMARPSQVEVQLSFTALSDLFEGLADADLDVLPDPQRDALAVALLRRDGNVAAHGPRVLGTAVLGVVRTLAAEAPLLVAVDDIQWLDPPTARVLRFALRRLGAAPVGILSTRRLAPDCPDPLDLDAALVGRLTHLTVGPLPAADVGTILLDRLGLRLRQHTVRRVHATAGGNPLFALELGRALAAAGESAASAPTLPVPDTLRDLVRHHLAALSEPARRVVLAASMLGAPTAALLVRALGDDTAAALLDAADAGVVEADAGVIRFAHPLLASTAYLDADPRQRRRLHAVLATVVSDAEEAARHRALAATGPDGVVAAALDEAAQRAAARGAFDTAAELAEQALLLTPPDDLEATQRRCVSAAGQQFHTGRYDRAAALAETVIAAAAAAAPGPDRARALQVRGWVHTNQDHPDLAVDTFTEAWQEASGDLCRRASIGLDLCDVLARLGDRPGTVRAVRAALDDATAAGDRALRAEALAFCAIVDFQRGLPLDDRAIDEALALETPGGHWAGLRRTASPSLAAGVVWLWAGRLVGSADALSRYAGWVQDRGLDPGIQLVFAGTWVGCWLGDLDLAQRYAGAARTMASEEPGGLVEAVALISEARIAAQRGATCLARRLLDAAEDPARTSAMAIPYLLQVRAALEVSVGNWPAVDALHGRFRDAVVASDIVNPGAAPFLLDEVEALIMLGRLDEAEACLAELAGTAARIGLDWVLAGVARNRALLAAAGGHQAAAGRAAHEAVARITSYPMPVERGRALLVKGRVERRMKAKGAASRSLRAAVAEFEAAGAGAWAARAEEELGRVGLRPPAPDGLTPTEAQVAALVARGLTNRQVAEQVFLTAKSVEGVLSRVYRKVGVTSRAGLAAHLAGHSRLLDGDR